MSLFDNELILLGGWLTAMLETAANNPAPAAATRGSSQSLINTPAACTHELICENDKFVLIKFPLFT